RLERLVFAARKSPGIADTLNARVALFELELLDKDVELAVIDIVAAGEETAGRQEQGDIGIEAVVDSVLGGLHRVLEAARVALASRVIKAVGRGRRRDQGDDQDNEG